MLRKSPLVITLALRKWRSYMGLHSCARDAHGTQIPKRGLWPRCIRGRLSIGGFFTQVIFMRGLGAAACCGVIIIVAAQNVVASLSRRMKHRWHTRCV